MYKGPVDKDKGGQDWGWEMGVGAVGESSGGKMETTVLETIKNIKILLLIN